MSSRGRKEDTQKSEDTFLELLFSCKLTGYPSGRPKSIHFHMHLLTWTSKVKYFFRFLIIMTRKGSLIPNVFFGSAGHVIYVVLQREETLINTPGAFSSVVYTAKTLGPRAELESRSKRSRYTTQ